MLIVSIIALLLILLLLGLPLVFALGITSTVYCFGAGINPALMAQRMTSAVDSFLILAIPFFFLAGELMNACKLTDRIIGMAKALVGHIHGGLAQVNIFASLIFSGMSGSPTADTTALGSVLIPAMKREGYPAPFSAAVTVASSMVGPMVPPSVALVIYGTLADVSIGRLLLAGILPGFVIIATQMIFTYFYARANKFPRYERATLRQTGDAIRHGAAAVLFPAIIVGGILGGVFSPTEAAAVGVAGAVISAATQRRLDAQMLGRAAFDTLKVSAMILWITIGAKAFVAIFTGTGGADFMLAQIEALEADRYVILLVMMLILVFLGMFLDEIGIILLCVPVFLPIIEFLEFDPLWFGIIFLISAQMAYITPPFGYTLFYLKGVVPPSIGMETIYRAIVPFFLLQVTGLLICVVWPELVLWLPQQMMSR